MTDFYFNDLRVLRPLFPELTDAQSDTLCLLCSGCSEIQVSEIQNKHLATVKKQKIAICKKLGTPTFSASTQLANFRLLVSILHYVNKVTFVQ